MNRLIRTVWLVVVALLATGAVASTPTLAADPVDDTGRPTFSHIMVVVIENQSYDDLVGNKDAPFINDVLERNHASATRFFAPFHNSPADYFALSSGRGYTKGDGGEWGGTCNPSPTCSTDDVSVFQQLNEAGKRWRIYSEDQQSNCQTRNSGKYWVGHNPAVFYRNLGPNDYVDTGNGTCAKDDVPWEELPRDLANGTLPELAFLIPNNCNNMHDSCKPVSHPIRQGDTWLEAVLAGDAVVPGGLTEWAKSNDTLIVITFDEGGFSDVANCCPYSPEGGGGHIPTWVIGPDEKVKADGYQSEVDYSLYSVLRMVQTNFGLPLLGHAADDVTADMSDFFPSRVRLEHSANVAGSRASVTGVDFQPNERVTLRWDCEEPGCDGPRLATVTADAQGGFETTVTVPRKAEVGAHRIGAAGATSDRFGVTSFTVRAPLTASPTATFRGGPMDVEGAGFGNEETVDVSLDCAEAECDPVALGSVDVDEFGAFGRTPFTVPGTTANGKYLLRAEGTESGRVNEMTVWIVEGVTVEPLRGPSGATVTLAGRGYVPNSEIEIAWDCRKANCARDVLASVTADGNGDFRAEVTVPPDAEDGNVAIGAIGSRNRDFARAWFKVKAPLAMYPDAAPPGRKLALSGAGFAANEQVEIRWNCDQPGCQQPVVAVGDSTELGELSQVEVAVPEGIPGGTYVVGGTGLTSGVFAKTEFTVTSRVTLSPSKGAAGWNVTLDGAGFMPGQPLTLAWDCPEGGCEPTTASADDTGRLTGLKLRVPADSPIGSRILTVTVADADPIELPYQVLEEAEAGAEVPAAPGASAAPATRRDTGSTVGSLGSFLAPALVVGLVLLAVLLLPGLRSRRGQRGA